MTDKLFENPNFLKVVSLVMALLLWFYMGVQNPETEVTYRGVPVQIVMQNAQLENGVSAIGAGGDSVDITLKGNKNVLARITSSDIYATIEIDASLSPGIYYFPINVTLPLDSVGITGKNPTGYDVRVDRMDTAVIPVRAEVSYGIDTDGYIIDSPEIRPEAIEVRGPASEIAVLKEAVVKLNITEENVMEEYVNLPITLYDTTGSAADTTYLETTVRSVAVSPRISVRRTLPVRVDFINLPDGWMSADFSYTVSPASIEIKVPLHESSSMTEYVAGQVDLSLYPESTTLSLPIAPEYIQDGGVDAVEVSLRFGELITADYELHSLEFDNVPDGCSYEVLTQLPLAVTVRGPADIMETYDGSGLRGIIDLSSAAPGATLDLPVRIVTGNQEAGQIGSIRVTVYVGQTAAADGGE